MKKRLAIFAGYDRDAIISDYVVYYLKALNALTDVVVVYDNAVPEEELSKVKDLSLHQICEPHGEYDFGSYKRGYQWAKNSGLLERYETVVFTNDSIFGPFHDLKPIFERFDHDEAVDFWGMFKIIKNVHHIQGYFIAFKQRVFCSDVFDKTVMSVQKEEDRSKVVSKYELGLSDALHKAGFRSMGLLSGKKYSARNKDAIRIIRKGFPFLKKALFQPDQQGALMCECLHRYKRAVPRVCPDYDMDMIKRYVLRFMNEEAFRQMMRRMWLRSSFKVRFFYESRVTISGKRLIKVLRIPIYNKPIRG